MRIFLPWWLAVRVRHQDWVILVLLLLCYMSKTSCFSCSSSFFILCKLLCNGATRLGAIVLRSQFAMTKRPPGRDTRSESLRERTTSVIVLIMYKLVEYSLAWETSPPMPRWRYPSSKGVHWETTTCGYKNLVPHFEHKLFLTATPYNGYPESFTALLELLDS